MKLCSCKREKISIIEHFLHMFSYSLKRKVPFVLLPFKINKDERINLKFLTKSAEFVRRNKRSNITSIFKEQNS